MMWPGIAYHHHVSECCDDLGGPQFSPKLSQAILAASVQTTVTFFLKVEGGQPQRATEVV